MRTHARRTIAGAAIAAFALIAAACGSGGDGGTIEGPTITIGSANFSENALVAEIYAQALESEGYQVERKLNIGSREIYAPALESGELDLIPEYIGTMLTYLGGTASPDSAETHAALQVAWEPAGIDVLDYASAQDKNGFVVTRATADEFGLAKVSDLAAYNGTLVLGGPPECPEREFCLKGLESVYGLSFAEFRPLDVGGPITVAALEGDEIQVGLLFTSDGTIVAKDFVLLEDDKNLQPAENLAPAVRSEIIEAYGDKFAETLQKVSSKLTTAELTAMNKLVGIDGQDPEQVATDWLAANGITG
jgi:osmoprotectant transport system substrate-binding protein